MILLTAALARSCCCGKKVFPAVAYDFEILGVDGQIAVISDRTRDMIRKAYFHDSALLRRYNWKRNGTREL